MTSHLVQSVQRAGVGFTIYRAAGVLGVGGNAEVVQVAVGFGLATARSGLVDRGVCFSGEVGCRGFGLVEEAHERSDGS
ncbi:MAG: hypothetical protein WBG36_01630 [Ornithinimicrobium sp.]